MNTHFRPRPLRCFHAALQAAALSLACYGLPSAAIADEADLWSGLGSGMSNEVWALAHDGSVLYAGGSFLEAGGVAANKIAKWDGESWSPLAGGLNGQVRALALLGTDLYAAGDFFEADGIPASRIAKWDGENWSALGVGVNDAVFALAVLGNNLYVGGNFTSAGGLSAKGIARWNGAAWSALGSGVEGGVYSIAAREGQVVAGGFFVEAGGVEANWIASWDGSEWEPLGAGMDAPVDALVFDGAYLYAGGQFSVAGGTTAYHVARWDGEAWFPLGSGMSYTVRALALRSGKLYAGGSFSVAGGVDASAVAVWNGSAWSPLGGGLSFDFITAGDVRALAIAGDTLFAGGVFSHAGEGEAPFIAQANLAAPPSLSGLDPGEGVLSPAFSAGTTAYALSVPSGTDQISFTATASDPSLLLAVRIAGGSYSAVDSGTASAALPLAFGNNLVEIRVTSTDTSERVYSVTVTRPSPPFLSLTRPRAFPRTSVGKRSKPQAIRVRNFGGTAATGIAVRLSGKAARDFRLTRPALTLAPGATTIFRATFRPRAKGLRKATVTVRASNAAARSVPLKGRGR